MEQTKVKKRLSGIELLQIIAIFLICISHAVQTSELFINYIPSVDIQIILLKLFRYFGNVGNIIFIIASSYFLINKKSVVKSQRIFNMLLDSCLISITIFFGFIIFGGGSLSALDIVKQFLPDLFFNVWFIPAYVIFYLLHLIFNFFIYNMNYKQHLAFLFMLILVYFLPWSTLSLEFGLSSIPGFWIIYFVVAFIKIYCPNFCESKKKNRICFFVFLVLFVSCVLLENFIPMIYPPFYKLPIFHDFAVLLLLPMLLSLFFIFKNIKFYSKTVNFLSSCSLFVYCIHENVLVRTFLRPYYYQIVLAYNFDLYFLWIMILGVVLFVASYLLAVAYHFSLHKITLFLSNKMSIIIKKLGK